MTAMNNVTGMMDQLNGNSLASNDNNVNKNEILANTVNLPAGLGCGERKNRGVGGRGEGLVAGTG